MSLYLSKLRLSGKSAIQSVADLLLPETPYTNRRLAQHKLLWAAFSDCPERTRDFLWREESKGVFYTLSARPPEKIDIFEQDVREFSPVLSAGDRLRFKMRVNATRTKMGSEDKKIASAKRKKSSQFRVDVVMDALQAVSLEDRAAKRLEVAHVAGRDWMDRQGVHSGFKLDEYVCDGYQTEIIDYRKRGKKPQFGILDLSGVIEVTDPVAFVGRLASGFGRAKAYGCGMMLIQRA